MEDNKIIEPIVYEKPCLLEFCNWGGGKNGIAGESTPEFPPSCPGGNDPD